MEEEADRNLVVALLGRDAALVELGADRSALLFRDADRDVEPGPAALVEREGGRTAEIAITG